MRLAVKRMNRAKGRRQTQAEPLNRGSIERMLEVKTPGRLHRRVAEAKREVPLIALRNAALVAIAYDTLLRRSELVSLLIGDLNSGGEGSGTVLVRRSKADQEGEGTIKYLAPDTMAHIGAWLTAARLESGPLFRPLSKGGQVGLSALGGGEVARVFRDLATAAGLKLARLPSGLRMIMDASAIGLTGASPHIVDLALTSMALSVERTSQHFGDDISAADVNAGLGSAGGILRTFAMVPGGADWPSSEDLLVWKDLVPILLSQTTGALHWQRIRARGHAYASGIASAAAAAATKH